MRGCESAQVRRDGSANSPARLVVISKSDLPRAWDLAEMSLEPTDVVETSASTGAGLDALRRRVVAVLTDHEELRDTPQISNVRHLALVNDALVSLERADAAMVSGATEELVLIDLASARQALEEVTGHRSADDMLRHIFQRFCVGK